MKIYNTEHRPSNYVRWCLKQLMPLQLHAPLINYGPLNSSESYPSW